MSEWREKKLAKAKRKYPSIFGDVDLCTGYIDTKNIKPQEKDKLLINCMKRLDELKRLQQIECDYEELNATTKEDALNFRGWCTVESKKERIQKIRIYVDDGTEEIQSQKELELNEPLSSICTKEEFDEWCYSLMPRKKRTYKKDYGDSVVLSSPLTSNEGEDHRSTEALRITSRTNKNKSKGGFHTSKSDKKLGLPEIVKMEVRCIKCGWIHVIEDKSIATKFRQKLNTCPKCNSTELQLKNPYPFQFKEPYISSEREIRLIILNTLFNLGLIVWDCQPPLPYKCREPIIVDGIDMMLLHGDIIYYDGMRYHVIELKWSRLRPVPPKKGHKAWSVRRQSFGLSDVQYALIRRGGGHLVVISESPRTDQEKFEMGSAINKKESLDQIEVLRKKMGRNERPYDIAIADESGIEMIRGKQKFKEDHKISITYDKIAQNSVITFSAYLNNLPTLIAKKLLSLRGKRK